MYEKSLQELRIALDDLESSQKRHIAMLENMLENTMKKQQLQMDGIQRAVLGEPSNSNCEVTSYIDKHGF